jgi:hypothetical protein
MKTHKDLLVFITWLFFATFYYILIIPLFVLNFIVSKITRRKSWLEQAREAEI